MSPVIRNAVRGFESIATAVVDECQISESEERERRTRSYGHNSRNMDMGSLPTGDSITSDSTISLIRAMLAYIAALLVFTAVVVAIISSLVPITATATAASSICG